jgi:hypothetical protein
VIIEAIWLAVLLTEQASPKPAPLPWAPEVRCQLNPAHPQGLHPIAYRELQNLKLAHRITQGFNPASERGNVHFADGSIDGKPYTAAVDISVRCLTEAQIKMLLARLAEAGFASWYRKQGRDDWNGPPHIHAVWAGCRLKPFLKYQVESWLDGNNGLDSNRPYEFWQASTAQKDKIRILYRANN